VVRLAVEPLEGSQLGLLATALNPEDSNGAYAGGVDWTLLTDDRLYSFKGQVAGSLRMDEVWGREASNGGALWTQLARQGGETFRAWATYQVYGPGFDPNDLGYLSRDDLQRYELHLQLRRVVPTGPFHQLLAGVRPSGSTNTSGLDLGQGGQVYVKAKWANSWWTELGAYGKGPHWDDREPRGGPALELPAEGGGWLWARTAANKMVAGRIWAMSGSEPFGYFLIVNPALELRFGRVEIDLAPGFYHEVGELAYVDTLDSDEPAETTVVGRLDLDKVDLKVTGTLVILRDLTLQLTTQLLLARGDYSRFRRLLPGGGDEPYDYPNEWADFTSADLRIQALARWEYLPGSALYLVYTHYGQGTGATGDPIELRTAAGTLEREEREQVWMLKLSHRFG